MRDQVRVLRAHRRLLNQRPDKVETGRDRTRQRRPDARRHRRLRGPHRHRGSQGRAIRYTQCLVRADAVASVGIVGDSYDDAVPKRSTRCSGSNASATPSCAPSAAGRRSRTSRSRSRSKSTGSIGARTRDRADPARRVRGRALGIPFPSQLRWRTGSSRSRFQVTEPPQTRGASVDSSAPSAANSRVWEFDADLRPSPGGVGDLQGCPVFASDGFDDG